eukprot:scaffold347_cov239-Pinguiococcus_pyrenoidosus.AAC.39
MDQLFGRGRRTRCHRSKTLLRYRLVESPRNRARQQTFAQPQEECWASRSAASPCSRRKLRGATAASRRWVSTDVRPERNTTRQKAATHLCPRFPRFLIHKHHGQLLRHFRLLVENGSNMGGLELPVASRRRNQRTRRGLLSLLGRSLHRLAACEARHRRCCEAPPGNPAEPSPSLTCPQQRRLRLFWRRLAHTLRN